MRKSEIITAIVIIAFTTLAVFVILGISRSILLNSYNSIEGEIRQIKVMQKQVANINRNTDEKLNSIEAELDRLKNNNPRLVKVTVTFYCPAEKGINSDSDPTNTATMTKPISGHTIAISKSLFEKGWLGYRVYIEGWGVGKITDRMGKSIEGDCIDICVGTKKEAIEMGRRNNIMMIRL